jgi:hypothetical protein
MGKSKRFGLMLSPQEKVALQHLAILERLSAAAVVRRLIWREAARLQLLPMDEENVRSPGLTGDVQT